MQVEDRINYFCILGGGGIRGASYIGMLEVLEEMNINITGFAGSSVGSVISSLYAIGYTPSELKELALNIKLDTFKDLFFTLGKDFGLCKGDNFLYWLKDLLEQRFYNESYKKDNNSPIRFKDLEKDLIIIATDISNNYYKEFSKYTTPDIEIAQAVRASISIPGLFKPVWHEEACLVDGDVIKSLPIWKLSNNIIAKNSRILEFRLEGEKHKEIKNSIDYVAALVNTASNISTDFIIDLYGHKDEYDYIKINAGKIFPTDIIINKEQKEKLIELGKNTTIEHFKSEFYEKRNNLKQKYTQIEVYLKQIKDNIEKNYAKEARFLLGDMILYTVENKKCLNEIVFNKVIQLKQTLSENFYKSRFFGRLKVRKKSEALNEINEFIQELESYIKELEVYLATIKNI